jgi:hypothetical protein
MLFFVTGASGSGKSASRNGLQDRFPGMAWYDFDAAMSLIPKNLTGRAGAQWLVEYWLQRALEHQAQGQDVGICGQIIFGEILACPSAEAISGIKVCLLDCHDVVRMDRLSTLTLPPDASPIVNQQMLNWASWTRMHAIDPQWEPDIIRKNGAPGMHWERWADWQRGDPRWHVWTLDTTTLTIPEVVEAVANWVQAERER